MSAVLLLGVPGQLKTVLDRLTATRAGNLDQINATRMAKVDTINTRVDTTVSSRASAAALTTAQTDITTIKTTTSATNASANTLTTRLSAARAGYLDLLPDLPGGSSISSLIGTPPAGVDGILLPSGISPSRLAENTLLLDATDNTLDTNWVTSGSLTGKGVIQHLSVYWETYTGSYQQGVRITIDGVVVFEREITSLLGTAKDELFVLVGGFVLGASYDLCQAQLSGHLPFRSSVLVETRATASRHRGALIGGYML